MGRPLGAVSLAGRGDVATVVIRPDSAADVHGLVRESVLLMGRRLPDLDRLLREAGRDMLGRLSGVDPPQLYAAFDAASHAELRAALVALGEARRRPRSLTPEGEQLVRMWARDGEPLQRLLEFSEPWNRVLSEHWIDAVQQTASETHASSEVTREAIGVCLGYVSGVATLMAGAHASQVAELRAGRPRAELRIVQDLLGGRACMPAALAYDLSLTHAAFIAWGAGAADVTAFLRARLRRHVLAVAVSENLTWGWIGSHGHLDPASLRRLERDLESLDVSLAFGRPGAGIEGFRRSHEQAREARVVGAARGQRLTVHDEVTLELLASQNPERARAFVLDELGPLAAAGPREPGLRRTLEVYLSSSLNATAAAARLAVHDQTVTNRLRRIEDLIGRPIQTRRVELDTALRLAYLVER